MAHTGQGPLNRDTRSGGLSACCVRPARRGFTLIEVVVAMSILLIAVFGLLVSYTSYYRQVVIERIATTGQNFAQLLLEDAEGLPKGLLATLTSTSSPYAGSTVYPLNNYPANTATDPKVYDTGSPDPADGGNWDSPTLDATYVVEPVWTIADAAGNPHAPTGPSDLPTGLTVPEGMIKPDVIVYTDLNGVSSYAYRITVNKNVYPGFKKRIRITDLGSGSFKIDVTIFWKLSGTVQKYTLSTVR